MAELLSQTFFQIDEPLRGIGILDVTDSIWYENS